MSSASNVIVPATICSATPVSFRLLIRAWFRQIERLRNIDPAAFTQLWSASGLDRHHRLGQDISDGQTVSGLLVNCAVTSTPSLSYCDEFCEIG